MMLTLLPLCGVAGTRCAPDEGLDSNLVECQLLGCENLHVVWPEGAAMMSWFGTNGSS